MLVDVMPVERRKWVAVTPVEVGKVDAGLSPQTGQRFVARSNQKCKLVVRDLNLFQVRTDSVRFPLRRCAAVVVLGECSEQNRGVSRARLNRYHLAGQVIGDPTQDP